MEWSGEGGRENKMEYCIMLFTLLKRSSMNAYISEEYQYQCAFYVLIFLNINLHKFQPTFPINLSMC